MEDLRRQAPCWTLSSDHALLQYLQAFSAQLSGQMADCRRSLDDLGLTVTDISTDLSRVGTNLTLLSNGRFIEKASLAV